MSSTLVALSPFLALTLAPLIVMLGIGVRRRHTQTLTLTVFLLLGVLALIGLTSKAGATQVTPLLRIDAFGLFYAGFAVIVALLLIPLGLRYLSNRDAQPEEFYVLLLLAVAASAYLGCSTHFASFYVALEVLSVSQYALIAYVRRDRRGTEASLKYLVLAAASAAFLLFGMALVYAELGTMQFYELAQVSGEEMNNKVVLLGIAMMLASIGFKLTVAPFHMWAADVYEGAPASVAVFIATVSKSAILSVLIRFHLVADVPFVASLLTFLAVGAAASMIVGTLLALVQQNLKRLLAYSSIAHIGFILTGLLADGSTASNAVTFYLVVYAAASLGAFGVIMALSPHQLEGRDFEHIENYRGLFHTKPLMAGVLSVSLLSLAGIPLTAGFLGKIHVLFAGVQAGPVWLLVVFALTSAAGVYYYLRIIVLMALPSQESPHDPPIPRVPAIENSILIGLSVASLLLGIYPAPLLMLIEIWIR